MPIILENLTMAFGGSIVLDRLCHTFPDGSVTCITGPSGCGKTTLTNLLLGLLTPCSGSVHGLDGRRVAAVFQEDRLLEHCSPTANLRAACPSAPPAEISAALSAVGLADAARQPVRELSGGMKRRVAILRALLAESEVLIMDEPFRGLDAETRDRVIRHMLPRIEGKTLVVVTHDPDEALLLGGVILSL